MREFLFKSAGVDPKLIEMCPTQQQKYLSLGAVVCLVGISASCSFGYALFLIFQTVPHGVVGGICCGFAIYWIERVLLSSMRPHTNPWSEIKQVIWRLLLAIVVALAVSKPIELRMFKSEIDEEMANRHVKEHLEDKARVESSPAYANAISKLEQDNADLQHQISDARVTSQAAFEEQFGAEKSASGISSSDLKGRAGQLNERLQNITLANEKRIKENTAQIASIKTEEAAELDRSDKSHIGADALMNRIKSLEALSSKEEVVRVTSIIITLLMLFFDLTPISVKAFAAFNKHRPYERLLESHEAKEEAVAETIAHEATVRKETEKKLMEAHYRSQLQAHLETMKHIEGIVADTHKKLAEEYTKKWADHTKNQMDQDPDAFFANNKI